MKSGIEKCQLATLQLCGPENPPHRDEEVEWLCLSEGPRLDVVHVPGDEPVEDGVHGEHEEDVAHGQVVVGEQGLVQGVPLKVDFFWGGGGGKFIFMLCTFARRNFY